MADILILADDLSGAADCAGVCLSAGASPLVLIDPTADQGDAGVIAVDVDSRAKPPLEAGIAMAAAVERLLNSDTKILYQKMDSTLRGSWARETTCLLQSVTKVRGVQPLAIVAPAYPAAGRTTLGGRSFLNGTALEDTEVWLREGLTRPAEPGVWLAAEGLRVAHACIADIQQGSHQLSALFAAESKAGANAIVCDAETEADLALIAGAALMLQPMPLCVGSAGLMSALARVGERTTCAAPRPVAVAMPVLILVGSASRVSHEQVRVLARERAVSTIVIAPSVLREGLESNQLRVHAEQMDTALRSGGNLVVTVDGCEGVDLREGPQFSATLAELVAPRLHRFGGLIATGGETARALLRGSGVSGLRIHSEVEPGVPLSSALGAVEIPVVTKAGAFGDSLTLIRCLDAIRGHSSGV